MLHEFSPDELGIIQNSYISKTAKQIAALLDCPAAAVEAEINRLQPSVKSKQQLTAERIAARPAKIKPPKKIRVPKKELRRQEELRKKILDEKKKRGNVENEWRQQRTGNLNREKKFKNNKVDYAQMTSIRINNKTIIYAKPGENVEAVKARFFKNYSKVLNKD
jgi:multidrug resistance efflux pump